MIGSTSRPVSKLCKIITPGRPCLFRADVGVERRWQGGDGYTAGVWTGLGVEQNIDRNWRVGMFPRVWLTRYDEGTDSAQPRGRSLGLYAARRVGPGWLTAQGKVSRETPERRTRRWISHEVSVHYALDIGRDWSVEVQAGLSRTDTQATASDMRRDLRPYRLVPHEAMVCAGAGSGCAR